MALTGWEVHVVSTDVDERSHPGEDGRTLADRLALAKARDAVQKSDDRSVLLAADTIVQCDDQLLGKPIDAADAVRMLMMLRGREHSVVTAMALISAGEEAAMEICETMVPMREYTSDEIQDYINSGYAMDKAGAYGIQDDFFQPVALDLLTGCFANVMGLPLCHLVRAVRRMGIEPPNDVPVECQACTGYTCPVYAEILRDVS
jgi:MAF protein